jgi:F1F0 ATPase subunit 2
MNETLLLMLALLAGLLFGAIFFAGLWWTVRRGLASPRPALWFTCSLLLRTGIVVAGFYFVAGADWRRMVACLLGFIAARIIVMRLIGKRYPMEMKHESV